MTDYQAALELLKILTEHDRALRSDSDKLLALYRKCLEAVRAPTVDHP